MHATCRAPFAFPVLVVCVTITVSRSELTTTILSMSTGLSRRRVGGSSTPGIDGDVTSNLGALANETTTAASATISQSSLPAPANGGPVHAGTALEGGSKIAYDPRDLMETEQDGGKMPTLTLLEEVLLLGLKDKQVSAQSVLAPMSSTHVKQ